MARILLAEDQSLCCARLIRALQNDGHEVIWVTSVSDAYTYVCSPDLVIDIVLSDYNLGRYEGLEIWQALRASSHRKTPFIGSSSKMNEGRKGSWQMVADHGNDPHFYPIPKVDDEWDDQAVRTQIKKLGF